MDRAELLYSQTEDVAGESPMFGEDGVFSQYSGAEQIQFGDYHGTLNQAMAECPHIRALPKEALEAVLTATVVVDERSVHTESSDPKKKLV